MTRRALTLLALPWLSACNGGGGETTETTETTVVGTSTTGTSTIDDPTTTTTVEPTTVEPTTVEPTTVEPMTSTTTPPEDTSTTGDETTGATTEEQTGTTGPGVDCGAIPPGPLTPELLWTGYDGSEDLGFDGMGRLALKRDDELVLVTADQQETVITQGLPQVYGTRVAVTGDLLLALPSEGKLIAVAPNGDSTDLATDLAGPNGVYVDPSGGVWLTEFGGSRVVRFDADANKTTIYQGPAAMSANGVVLDVARSLVFFTNYGAGRLLKIAVDAQGQPMGDPIEVAAVQGAKLDGLALDACGHVYAVDQGNSRLYRARLTAGAELDGDVELLAEFAKNVANAQFGVGDGFDPQSLYAAGNPGDVYRVVVGVPGAPIGLP